MQQRHFIGQSDPKSFIDADDKGAVRASNEYARRSSMRQPLPDTNARETGQLIKRLVSVTALYLRPGIVSVGGPDCLRLELPRFSVF
jgi:hypothetical protein